MTRVAWYRFRTTFRHRVGGYLMLVVVVGLIGGLALGSLTAARRTESSYPQYLAGTNPSDLVVQPSTTVSCTSRFVSAISHLPRVRHVGCAFALDAETLASNGAINSILLTQVELVASLDGMFANQDRVKIIDGRSARARRVNEVVARPAAAARFHLHVGSRILIGIDTSSEPPLGRPYRRVDFDVVGIGVFNTQIIQDDIDRGHTGFLLGTPALANEFHSCCTSLTYDGLQLANGSQSDVRVEREYAVLVDKTFGVQNAQLQVYATSVIEADAERAIRPETTALGIFGGIAFLATLIVAVQILSRRLRENAAEADVLWALGASPRAVLADGLGGAVVAILLGSVLAAGVGVALSPTAVFGPVRSVDDALGFDLDWTVAGLGAAAFALAISASAVTIARRLAPHKPANALQGTEGDSVVVRAAIKAGLRPSALIGLRFAVQTGQGRAAVPVRSAIIGGVLAVGVVIGTLTFGSSLTTLATRPALYGWNFNSSLYSTDGFGPIPSVVVDPLLAKDHSIAAATGVYFGTLEINNEAVPVIGAPLRGGWSPSILTGKRLAQSRQILLGSSTLAALHKHVGDTVDVTIQRVALRLRIVGTAALPTIGTPLGLHASVSSGAVLSTAIIPASLLDAYGPFSGPNAIFVRFRPGVSTTSGDRTLATITKDLTAVSRSPKIVAESKGDSAGLTFEVLNEQRPAEIVNYRSMGTTPAVLAGALAAGATTALGLTLVASVRRRRRELAVLKTLGLTRRQLALTVATQATAIALIGLAMGIPLGIAAGRGLWLLFAHQLSTVAEPVIPIALIVVASLGTLLLAVVAASLPGRLAARTPTAILLRTE